MDVHIRILQCSRLVKILTPVATGIRTAVNLSYQTISSHDPEHEVKPPVIMCHSLLGTKENWKYFGKTVHTLTKRVVVRLDLRNHGYSPQTKSHRYEEQAEDVLQLMQKLNLPQASFLGHNMGARTAMCVALMEPTAVASLIVLDMSPVSTCREFKVYFPRLLEKMAEVKWTEKRNVNRARKAIKKQLKHVIHDDTIMKYVLSNINVKSDGIIGWMCNIETLIRHFKYIASFPSSLRKTKYMGPTMFIGGQLSDYLPADDLPRIREIFPNAVVKYVRQGGHFLHAVDPKPVLELAIPFLKTQTHDGD